MNLINALATLITALAVMFGISLVLSLPVMLLWDWLMPTLFNLKEITWLQAWGLNFLCGILFRDKIKVTRGDK